MVTATLRTDSAGQLEAIHYRTVNAGRSETSVVKAAILEAKIEVTWVIAVAPEIEGVSVIEAALAIVAPPEIEAVLVIVLASAVATVTAVHLAAAAIVLAIAVSRADPETVAPLAEVRVASMEPAVVPAAAVVLRAWADLAAAVAGAVVLAAAAVVVVGAVAVVAGGEIMNKQRKRGYTMSSNSSRQKLLSRVGTATLLGLLILSSAPTVSPQTTSPAMRGKAFETAQQAADSLVDATEKYDEAALTEILGPESFDLTHTGEPARDKENSAAFAAQARAKMKVDLNKAKTRATLIVGDEDWPFPIPIVKVGKSWYFDTKAGREELLLRRVGRNELDAIQICRGYVEAQHDYALLKHDNSGVNQYAQRIISTAGMQDGLAWRNPDGTWGGPIGEKVAEAIARGYSSRTEPYHGYFFKVLKGQGPAAPLGQMDFVVKGVMIGGFALIAAPAQYRNTGVKTFMVSHDGVVYQKDLGPTTLELFQTIDRFNPDKTWTPVSDALDYKLKPGWRSTFR